MSIVVKNFSKNPEPKFTYDVLIENQQDGKFKATLLGLPDCQELGNTETEAIEKLSQSLQHRLETAKIVTLEIEPIQSEHPWLKFAGMHKDNPLFDEVLAYIEEERKEFDVQMDECHTKSINEFDNYLEERGLTALDSVSKVILLMQRDQLLQTNDSENNL